jgi:outer membrane lipoprotein-sorting protein
MIKLLFVFAMLIPSVGTEAQKDDYAKGILDKMSEKYQGIPSFKVNFTYRLENKLEGIDEKFSGEIVIKGEKYKLMLSDQEIFNDGETLWTFLKDANEVNIDYYIPEEGDLSPNNIYNAYKSGYKYRFLEESKMGSRVLNVVELQPEDPKDPDKIFFKVVLNIDKSDNLIHSWRMHDRAGNVFTYTIDGFNPNVNAQDSQFVFNASDHPGVEIVDLR